MLFLAEVVEKEEFGVRKEVLSGIIILLLEWSIESVNEATLLPIVEMEKRLRLGRDRETLDSYYSIWPNATTKLSGLLAYFWPQKYREEKTEIDGFFLMMIDNRFGINFGIKLATLPINHRLWPSWSFIIIRITFRAYNYTKHIQKRKKEKLDWDCPLILKSTGNLNSSSFVHLIIMIVL